MIVGLGDYSGGGLVVEGTEVSEEDGSTLRSLVSYEGPEGQVRGWVTSALLSPRRPRAAEAPRAGMGESEPAKSDDWSASSPSFREEGGEERSCHCSLRAL